MSALSPEVVICNSSPRKFIWDSRTLGWLLPIRTSGCGSGALGLWVGVIAKQLQSNHAHGLGSNLDHDPLKKHKSWMKFPVITASLVLFVRLSYG